MEAKAKQKCTMEGCRHEARSKGFKEKEGGRCAKTCLIHPPILSLPGFPLPESNTPGIRQLTARGSVVVRAQGVASMAGNCGEKRYRLQQPAFARATIMRPRSARSVRWRWWRHKTASDGVVGVQRHKYHYNNARCAVHEHACCAKFCAYDAARAALR